ncbi:hypothetical protein ALC56_04589 [Trachymyrmex septentrionalis]|uniref:Uncharacterized protein n=1 Tax=Trachymyrmex septentrionalis TaxID=34720 RepID=A0A195FKX2_9HYME|nr:hypothetical protein ALC56_04589 [Trachymyrmex septentrionalis]
MVLAFICRIDNTSAARTEARLESYPVAMKDSRLDDGICHARDQQVASGYFFFTTTEWSAHAGGNGSITLSRHSIHRPTSRLVASENVSDNASSSYSMANPTNYSIIRQHTDDASCTLHTAKAACVQALLYSKYDRKSASQKQPQRLVDISLAYSLHRKPGRNVRHPTFGASENFLRLALSPPCNMFFYGRITEVTIMAEHSELSIEDFNPILYHTTEIKFVLQRNDYCNRHYLPLRPSRGGPTSTRRAKPDVCSNENTTYGIYREILYAGREEGEKRDRFEEDYTRAKSTSRNGSKLAPQ